MYENYYGLRANPFTLTPDPDFLFVSAEHREAIAGLTYAVLTRKGICALIGDAGTGKTTLLRTVIRAVPQQRAVFSVVLNPMLTTAEFLRTCVRGFGVDCDGAKDQLLANFQQFLMQVHQENRIAVLVVDEAHGLSADVLEEVRLLTNFETEKEKLLQIILSGQDELSALLDRHDLRQLKQRIAVRLHIKPLTRDAVSFYVHHRWGRVNKAPCPFDTGGLAAIAEVSGGIPRLINSVCDNALLFASSQGAKVITADQIMSVACDLRLVNGRAGRIDVQPKLASFVREEKPAAAHEPTFGPAPAVKAGAPALERPKRSWRLLFGTSEGNV